MATVGRTGSHLRIADECTQARIRSDPGGERGSPDSDRSSVELSAIWAAMRLLNRQGRLRPIAAALKRTTSLTWRPKAVRWNDGLGTMRLNLVHDEMHGRLRRWAHPAWKHAKHCVLEALLDDSVPELVADLPKGIGIRVVYYLCEREDRFSQLSWGCNCFVVERLHLLAGCKNRRSTVTNCSTISAPCSLAEL